MCEDLNDSLRNLSSQQKRIIVQRIKQEGTSSVDELAETLSGDGRHAKLSLKHFHLPQLAEHDYIEWNRETGVISRGPQFDQIGELFDLIDNHSQELPFQWP